VNVRRELSRIATKIDKENPSVALTTVPPSFDDLWPLDATPDDPAPAEIRRACQQIQAAWSDRERCYRAAVRRPTELDERPDEGFRPGA
jgi:hypothetical protein